jgi:hypothetical protein
MCLEFNGNLLSLSLVNRLFAKSHLCVHGQMSLLQHDHLDLGLSSTTLFCFDSRFMLLGIPWYTFYYSIH